MSPLKSVFFSSESESDFLSLFPQASPPILILSPQIIFSPQNQHFTKISYFPSTFFRKINFRFSKYFFLLKIRNPKKKIISPILLIIRSITLIIDIILIFAGFRLDFKLKMTTKTLVMTASGVLLVKQQRSNFPINCSVKICLFHCVHSEINIFNSNIIQTLDSWFY